MNVTISGEFYYVRINYSSGKLQNLWLMTLQKQVTYIMPFTLCKGNW